MKKILVIEDDLATRANISTILELEGYCVLQATDGLNALEILTAEKPDLIICDIQMPNMTGISLLKRLNESNLSRDIPFIFLSARSANTDIRKGMLLGADDYLVKPFEVPELILAVKTRLDRVDIFNKNTERLRESIKLSLPHALLSPLNVILNSSDLLLEDFTSMSTEEVRQFLEIVSEAGYNLKGSIGKFLFITDLKLLSTMPAELKKMSEEQTPYPDATLKKVVSNLSGYRTDPHILFKSSKSDRPLKIPQTYLERIASELVENGVKFSPKEAKTIVSSEIREDMFILKVSNRSNEINAAGIHKIGEFIQLNRINNAIEGLGLGLSIVREIAVLFGLKFTLSVSDGMVTAECKFPMC